MQARKDACTESLKNALKKKCSVATFEDATGEPTPELDYCEPIEENEAKEEPLQEADDMTDEAFDEHISARVCVPQGDTKSHGTVVA